jgi:anti-sigma factor RsiW
MTDHIGDDAALYAIGALDDAERAAIDAHVADCDACARLLGDAEDEVARLVDAGPQHLLPREVSRAVPRAAAQPISLSRAAMAIAAVFVFGFIPSMYFWQQNRAMHDTMATDTAVMNQLASAPFHTASFGPMPGRGNAHVMYSPDGSWYVIVVRGATKALSVAWMHDGKRDMLGTAEPHGDVAMLYLPQSHRMDQLALVDGETVVAEAQLPF